MVSLNIAHYWNPAALTPTSRSTEPIHSVPDAVNRARYLPFIDTAISTNAKGFGSSIGTSYNYTEPDKHLETHHSLWNFNYTEDIVRIQWNLW